jgi:hypothetical protein
MARAPSSRWFPILVALLCAMPSPVPAQAFRCAEPDTAIQQGQQDQQPVELIPYRAFRPGSWGSDGRHRDLEFLWDPMNDSTLTQDVRTTLNNFGHTLVDSTGRNPFGFAMGDFQLIYEYFRNPRYGSNYDPFDPTDSSSVWVGQRTTTYNASDRSHSDVDMFPPTRNPDVGGKSPSDFWSGEEDLSTGHSAADIKHENSVMVKSPTGAGRFDLTGTGWTRPDALQNVAFIHEFRHSLPKTTEAGARGEMFSAGAEAIGGNKTIEIGSDFP